MCSSEIYFIVPTTSWLGQAAVGVHGLVGRQKLVDFGGGKSGIKNGGFILRVTPAHGNTYTTKPQPSHIKWRHASLTHHRKENSASKICRQRFLSVVAEVTMY